MQKYQWEKVVSILLGEIELLEDERDSADTIITQAKLAQCNEKPKEQVDDIFYSDAEQIALLHKELAEQRKITENYKESFMELSAENDNLKQELRLKDAT